MYDIVVQRFFSDIPATGSNVAPQSTNNAGLSTNFAPQSINVAAHINIIPPKGIQIVALTSKFSAKTTNFGSLGRNSGG